MKLFVNSSDIEETREAVSWRVVDGVATNPPVVWKSREDLKLMGEIIQLLPDGEISLAVPSTDAESMIQEGSTLVACRPELIVEMTLDGLKVVSLLGKQDIKTNCTLIFSANQALLAARY